MILICKQCGRKEKAKIDSITKKVLNKNFVKWNKVWICIYCIDVSKLDQEKNNCNSFIDEIKEKITK